MLKYILLLFIIPFYDAHTNRAVGRYDNFILAQNSPLVSFVSVYKHWPNKSTIIPRGGLNENDCARIFTGTKWIVHGLWPFKLAGGSPTYCRKGPDGGRTLTYKPKHMNKIFKKKLKTTWPHLSANKTKKSIWNTEWIKHGTCATDNQDMNTVEKYFYKTVELLNQYNVGSILERYNIIPGYNYTLNRIIESLTSYLQKGLLVRCLQIENTDPHQQYLLEVQICFNKTLHLDDCHRTGIYDCDDTQTVIYPKMIQD